MSTLLDPRVLAALATLIATIVNVQFDTVSVQTALPYVSGAILYLVGLYDKRPKDRLAEKTSQAPVQPADRTDSDAGPNGPAVS